MRLRTLGLAAVLAMGMAHSSSAFAPKAIGHERDFVTVGRDARSLQHTAWTTSSARVGGLAGWKIMWDRDTDVPLRMWGAGVVARGAVADAAIAEAAARRFLADHLDVLAPGASVADFVLVSNQLGAGSDLRTVGFEQHANGLRVLGGTIGFGFKGDRLTMVSSTALPNVHAAPPSSRLTAAGIAANAITWLAGSGHAVRTRSAAGASLLGTPGEISVLPIIHDRGRAIDVEYHTVESIVVETTAGEPGIWQVYLDARTGAPVARANRMESFASVILFDTTDQSPSQTRSNKAAPFLNTTINGQAVTTDGDGNVTFTGASPGTVALSLTGSFVAVGDASQAVDTGSGTLADGSDIVFSEATLPFSDAELDAYVAANRAKAFGKARLNPELAWFGEQMPVTVNDASSSCNAYSTGNDIHFYVPGPITLPDGTSGTCENTGRMADVVSHETGHSVHNNSVIPGQGAFPPTDGQSECLADTLAISITGDPGLGRGFFVSTSEDASSIPLREADQTPPLTWPGTTTEVHAEGQILDGALWDLRVALQTKLGTDAGFTQLLKIYYTIMQRSPTIPAAYVEALVGDDDDGDLSNGTPNKCEIDAAFARHDLADPTIATLGLSSPTASGLNITLAQPPAASGSGNCPPPVIASAVVAWHVGSAADATVTLTPGATSLSGAIPAQPDGTTVHYQVLATMADGTMVRFPDNPADPYYELYVGTVTNIYCTGFEPGFDGWTHSGTEDEWEVGVPFGIGGDPSVAHGGSGVAGIDLGHVPKSDGLYQSSANESLVSPQIPLGGQTSVHLQYYRWLGVEDAEFDQATIFANGKQVWINKQTGTDPDGTDEVNHIDKEWVFEDVDLTGAIGAGSQLQLTFGLTSDEGLDFGGWTIDDLCVVAVPPAPPGPGSGSDSDSGNPVTAGGGGCAVGGDAGGVPLALMALGMVVRRRRRAA